MDNNQNIERLVAEGRLEEAIEALSELIALNPDDDGLYFSRGKLYWRTGRRSAATADYVKAVDLNPSSPASRALEQARDVADFFNPDLYNP